jgi:hypothetical protein
MKVRFWRRVKALYCIYNYDSLIKPICYSFITYPYRWHFEAANSGFGGRGGWTEHEIWFRSGTK